MRLFNVDQVLKDISKAEEAGADKVPIDNLKYYFTTDVGLVKAIPIEWIQGWNHFIKSPDIKRMLEGWEKENGSN